MFNANVRNVTIPLFHFDKLLASFFALLLVARKMKKKEKQKKRRAYEPKLTPEGNFWIYILQFLFSALYIKCSFIYLFVCFPPEMMDSSTFKRFIASIENILENLEDMDFTTLGNMSEIFKVLPPS